MINPSGDISHRLSPGARSAMSKLCCVRTIRIATAAAV